MFTARSNKPKWLVFNWIINKLSLDHFIHSKLPLSLLSYQENTWTVPKEISTLPLTVLCLCMSKFNAYLCIWGISSFTSKMTFFTEGDRLCLLLSSTMNIHQSKQFEGLSLWHPVLVPASCGILLHSSGFITLI